MRDKRGAGFAPAEKAASPKTQNQPTHYYRKMEEKKYNRIKVAINVNEKKFYTPSPSFLLFTLPSTSSPLALLLDNPEYFGSIPLYLSPFS